MSGHLLNYVRCPYCGGNAANIGHPCDDDARQRAAQEAASRFFAAVKVDPADATVDQLRVKLAECEEALSATEAIVAEQDAEIERLRAIAETEQATRDRDWLAAITRWKNHHYGRVMCPQQIRDEIAGALDLLAIEMCPEVAGVGLTAGEIKHKYGHHVDDAGSGSVYALQKTDPQQPTKENNP